MPSHTPKKRASKRARELSSNKRVPVKRLLNKSKKKNWGNSLMAGDDVKVNSERLLKLEMQFKNLEKDLENQKQCFKDHKGKMEDGFHKIYEKLDRGMKILVGDGASDDSFKSLISKIQLKEELLSGEIKLLKDRLKDLPRIKMICYGALGFGTISGIVFAVRTFVEHSTR